MESTDSGDVSHPQESLESPFVLHERFVEQLAQQGWFRKPLVREAFASVARHLFLPAFRPSEVYRDVAITTTERAGVAVSSSSQPSFMALMIDQLDVRPGQRLLEVGTGTGYNATILSKLVGTSGCVISIGFRSVRNGA